MAKRRKNKSKNKSNRPRPHARVLPVAGPPFASKPIAVQDKRFFYAGAAAVIAMLIGVALWFIIHKSNEDTFLQSLAPMSERAEEVTEVKDRSAIGQDRVAPNARVLRDRLKSGGEGPEMVLVSAGSFQMGDLQGRDKAALPVHTVKIQKPFAIGRYEVTFEEYDKFAQTTGRKLPYDGGSGRGRQPVINFSWQEAVEYAKWLSTEAGKHYRLPTEAEWEYVTRGGTETAYWWGDQMKSGMANCAGCGSPWDEKLTAPVGSFPPNPFGLYDLTGNVWEWVEDCDHDDYNGAPADGSAWKKEGGGNCYLRVFRGGAWNYGVKGLRSSFRGRGDPALRSATIGFRLLREID